MQLSIKSNVEFITRWFSFAKELYNLVSIERPEIFTRNGVFYPFSAYSLIEYLFRDDYKFTRPFNAQQGEEIWEIARKYNTRVDLICAENNINSDCVEQNQKLYIPSV